MPFDAAPPARSHDAAPPVSAHDGAPHPVAELDGAPHPVAELTTDRLLLRGFRDADLDPFAAINADPVVMEHFVRPQTRAESAVFIDRIRAQWRGHGWGLWALERRDTGAFIGYAGLWPVRFEAAFEPKVEVGWRLAPADWGHGFATEAARAAVAFAFDVLGWPEIASFTAVGNARSRAVMRRIGMHHEPEWDFDHPAVPEGHPVRPHVFYRLRAADRPRQHG
jgi:ribosomal-protein-alanine N-acetyltransferase